MKLTGLKTVFLAFFISVLIRSYGSNHSEKIFLPAASAVNKGLRDWRVGVGAGYALYVGNQMDYSITFGYGNFHELRTNYTVGAYKLINTQFEWGMVFKNGSFQTLKSQNTQGLQCEYDEFQFNLQFSLNENVALRGDNVTYNVQGGI